jgi:ribose 5-phosphate isomerase B
MAQIGVASDHAGFELKCQIIQALTKAGVDFIDYGTQDSRPVDYPDYAKKLGEAIISKKVQRGILICGSGVGICVAANKIPGVRAGLCGDTYSAHQGVEHDNMNVLVIGAWVTGSQLALELIQTFLKAQFFPEERHLRRLEKILEIEAKYSKGGP